MPEKVEDQSTSADAERAAAAGDFVSAAKHLRTLLARQEAERGPSDPDLANTLNNLGVVSERTGDVAEAERCYRRAYAIVNAAFPADHPLVATSRENLTAFCEAQGIPLEPAATPAPVASPRLAAASGPIASSATAAPPEPTPAPRPVGSREPIAAPKPAVSPEPVASSKPVVSSKPAAASTSATPTAAKPAAPAAAKSSSEPSTPAATAEARELTALRERIAANKPAPALPRDDRSAPPVTPAKRSGWLPVAGLVVLGVIAALLFGHRGGQDNPAPKTASAPTPAPQPAPAPPPRAAAPEPAPNAAPPNPPAAAPSRPAVRENARGHDEAFTVLTAELCADLVRSGAWTCTPLPNPAKPGQLYFYTPIASARDVVVVHRWYRGDRMEESHELHVDANSIAGYRTYSRRTVSPGDWRVELRTTDGKVLKEERFTVR